MFKILTNINNILKNLSCCLVFWFTKLEGIQFGCLKLSLF